MVNQINSNFGRCAKLKHTEEELNNLDSVFDEPRYKKSADLEIPTLLVTNYIDKFEPIDKYLENKK